MSKYKLMKAVEGNFLPLNSKELKWFEDNGFQIDECTDESAMSVIINTKCQSTFFKAARAFQELASRETRYFLFDSNGAGIPFQVYGSYS